MHASVILSVVEQSTITSWSVATLQQMLTREPGRRGRGTDVQQLAAGSRAGRGAPYCPVATEATCLAVGRSRCISNARGATLRHSTGACA